MKRILIATALTASLASSAFAASEAEIAQIQRVVPDIDASTLTDTQVTNAMAIINSSDSRSQMMSQLSALLEHDMPMAMPAQPTEAQRAEIERYAPGVDFATVTQAQLDTAMAYINAGMSPSDTEARVQSVLIDDGTPVGTTNTATSAEVAILQRYLPDITVETMTEEELTNAMAVVYSGESDGDIRAQLEAMQM